MAKKGKFNLLSFVAWLTGVIVSLAVGSALADKILTVPSWLGGTLSDGIIAVIAGWIVIITTIIGVVLALVDAAS